MIYKQLTPKKLKNRITSSRHFNPETRHRTAFEACLTRIAGTAAGQGNFSLFYASGMNNPGGVKKNYV
jgi:hypothetical protein